jgi:hypothetical protein
VAHADLAKTALRRDDKASTVPGEREHAKAHPIS